MLGISIVANRFCNFEQVMQKLHLWFYFGQGIIFVEAPVVMMKFFQYVVSDDCRETSNIPIINAHKNLDSNKDIHILP